MPFIYHESTDYCLLGGDNAGRFVIWQKPGSGDKFAPYKDAASNLALVRFCSDFDYYAAATGFPVDTTINHLAATDAGTQLGNPSIFSVISYLTVTEVDYTLAAHNLGYVPNFMVSIGGIQFPAGCPVQVAGSGGRRSLCFWADATNLYVKDSARAGPDGLAAISITYHCTVFRASGPVAGAPLYSATPSRVRLGYGNVDTAERSLREPEIGETTYTFPTDETMDIVNGRIRFALPDGSIFDIGNVLGVGSYNGAFYGGPFKAMAL